MKSAETEVITASFEQLMEDARISTKQWLREARDMCKALEIEETPELLGQLVQAQAMSFGESCITAKLNRLAAALEDVSTTMTAGINVGAV